jgi:hypothetical protein
MKVSDKPLSKSSSNDKPKLVGQKFFREVSGGN